MQLLASDLKRTMALVGCRSVSGIDRELIAPGRRGHGSE
jgi:isopentenyl diphosphate isomerase/L-lactate dehydrogenase-like FMN-dependent dehydrogenase